MAPRLCAPQPALKEMVALLGLFLIVLVVVAESNSVSTKNGLKVRRNINHKRNHIVKSIQSEDGDIIDCIDMYKQPAFDHPALQNHTIQLTPTFDPRKEDLKETSNQPSSLERRDEVLSMSLMASQLWKKNGSCPKGTIPIRRVGDKELLKPNYGRKKPGRSPPTTKLNEKTSSFQYSNRSLAILFTEGWSYTGVKADIKVWNPYVESEDDYSISLISLKSGPPYDFESVETGWAVNPSVYGDAQTRLFVYWTVDGSVKTGCFDVTCPGFVQTSSEIALGSAIYPLSVPYGLPYEIILFIYKDPGTGNWWVQYGENINLGYWPVELFGDLRARAETAQWGGEVYSSKLGQPPHTKTAMGNGQFPDPISGNSGYMKRIRIRENSLILKFPEWVFMYFDEYYCYHTRYLEDYVEEPEFYYGGPGQNPMCP